MLEVQKFLQQNPLDALTAQYAISAKRHPEFPSLVMLKYSQIASPMGERLVQECRGLILDEANGWQVVSAPYFKFFNHHEGHAAAIDWSTARVYEKLDGSLMTLFHYAGEWRVASSGMPDAGGPVGGGWPHSFRELFWRVWGSWGYGLPIDTDHCFMFELMTPYNRVVVRHQEARLVLHGARNLRTGEECDPEHVAGQNAWDGVKRFPFGSVEAVVESSHALNPLESEGYIVCDAAFNRVKVKGAQYVALSHLRDGITSSRRHLLEIARANEGSEFLSYFPEFQADYDALRGEFEDLCQRIQTTFTGLRGIEAQKDFALEAVRYPFGWVLFELRKGKAETATELLSAVPIEKLQRLMGVTDAALLTTEG